MNPAFKDPRLPVAAILFAYLVLGLTVLGFNRSVEQIVITTLFCCALEVIFHYAFMKRLIFPLSAMITSFSLSFLLNYSHYSWMIALPPLLAIGSKYLFRLNNKHFFNPALFAVASSLFLSKDLITAAPAYQWNGLQHLSLFIIMLALLFVIPKVNRTWLVVSFLVTFTLQTALRAYVMRHHLPFETLFLGTVTSPSFFIFTFFMITDPATSPSSKKDQIIVGVSIAIADLIFHIFQSYYTFFYAAFTVASIRFIYFHVQKLKQSGLLGGLKDRFVSGGYWKQFVTAVCIILVVYQFSLHTAYAKTLLPAALFQFEKIESSVSGLNADAQGDLIANKVDPRVRHIAKWLLAETEGLASADYDGDGLIDLFAAQPLKLTTERAIIYKNLGNFQFAKVVLPALEQIIQSPEKFGIITNGIFSDYDNDGDQDLFLTVVHGNCQLLKNQLKETGTAEFTNVSDAVGFNQYCQSIAATFVDLNRDGLQDIFIANALEENLPEYNPPVHLNLFALPQPQFVDDRRMFNFMHASWNLADNGGHNKVFLQSADHKFNLQDPEKWGGIESRWSLAAGAADLNQDGWTDIYVANDFGPDELYYNKNGEGLELVKGKVFGSIGQDTYKGMNVSIADFDQMGWLSVYVSNVHHALQAEGSLLWQFSADVNLRYPKITERATQKAALNEERFGWGAAAADFDHDGWVDLAQANGMVDDTYDKKFESCPDYWYVNEKIARSPPAFHRYADRWGDIRGYCIFGKERNRLLSNRGPLAKPQFVDLAETVNMTEETNSRAALTADFNNSGKRDLIFSHPFSKPTLYKNTFTKANLNNWAGLVLEGNGRTCNRDSLGSKVTMTVARSDATQFSLTSEVQSVSGLLAQSDRRLHFGLGRDVKSARATVTWCGQETETFELVLNQYNTKKQAP